MTTTRGARSTQTAARRRSTMPPGRVSRDRSPARRSYRRSTGGAARRPRDARRVAGGRPPGARRRARRFRPPVSTRQRLVSEQPSCCSTIRSSTGTRAFSATSRRAPRRSGCSATSWPPALNQNIGAWRLSPLATEIEGQAVRWIAELVGFPADCGGLLVSGGNMANFVCFLAARAAKADVGRAQGRAVARRRIAGRLRVDRNPHVDSEGRGLVRARHRRHPLDSGRRRAAHGSLGRCARQIEATVGSGISRSSSSAPPARSAPAPSIRCRRLPRVPRRSVCGFTWTVRMARSAAQVPGAPDEPARR